MENPDSTRTFDPYRMLEETERYYRYYVDELEYVRNGRSVSDVMGAPTEHFPAIHDDFVR